MKRTRQRESAWWRRWDARHGELWRKVRKDPSAGQFFDQIERAISAARQRPTLRDEYLDAAWVLAEKLARETTNLAPDLAHFYGDQLPTAIFKVALEAWGESMLGPGPDLYVRGLPGTAITFNGEDANVPPESQSAADLLSLANFKKSFELLRSKTGKPGRPAGSRTTDGESRRAFALNQQGKEWIDIHEALFGDRPDRRTDPYYEAKQQLVRRRVKRGKALAAIN